MQAAPEVPHAPAATPAVQVPPEPQQPPWQSWVEEHARVHWPLATSQALPIGQSLALLQPQVPLPLPASTHAVPASLVAQVPHIAWTAPQAMAVSGFAQVLPLQQVPLQSDEPEQVVVHAPVVVLHASPVGQLLGPVQPASAASPFASAGASVGASPLASAASAASPFASTVASGGGGVESAVVTSAGAS
jgi:hypothetical protein